MECKILFVFCLYIVPLVFGLNGTVKYIAIIYRHGDRTPVDPYPTDPWRNESFWPVKFGELTNEGKKQHYALGQWFRKRYGDLISADFDPAEVYVRSTDTDRTLMSVLTNLAGMYPPSNKAAWNNDLKWQPIPVHTVPEKEDEVVAMLKPCPSYDAKMKEYIDSKFYKEELSKYKDLMDYMSVHTGRDIKDFADIEYVYSTLYIETLYNFTLPNWTRSVYPDKIRVPACYSFRIPTATTYLSRLSVGPLLKQIMHKMKIASEKSKSEGYIKMSMYSAHDDTVACVLNALKVFDGNCPVYTSTVMFELLYDESTSEYCVKILYRNSTEIVEPHLLAIPYCGECCPFERFQKLYKNLIPVDWTKECYKTEYTLIVVLASGLIINVMIFWLYQSCSKKDVGTSSGKYYIVSYPRED